MRASTSITGSPASRGIGHARTPAGGPVSSRVRPLRPEDLTEVAALRHRAFRHQQHDPARLASYFERMLLRNPWRDPELKSLVYEDDSGRIVGFIGAIPRPMTFKGQGIRAVVATQMMVAPEARGLAGRELVRALMAGPQDLTLSDAANTPARHLWKSVGAIEGALYGFEWERVLRPFQYLRHSTGPRHLALRAFGFAVQPLLEVGDALASLWTSDAPRRPAGSVEPLDADVIASAAPEVLADFDLAPVFEGDALRWLLAESAMKLEYGPLAGAVVRDGAGLVAGWFVHYVQPRGASRVVQIAARRRSHQLVVDHLLFDAYQRGALTVTGRLDATLLPLVEESQFIVRRQPPWTLAYARSAELLRAVESATAFVSRLDGESWLNF